MTKHWAYSLIGKPWAPGGTGPDSYDCWNLVRHVFATRYSIDMPEVRGGDFGIIENVAALKHAAEVSGWRPADGEPRDGDIVLMVGPEGRHVGVMIETAKGPRLLHADGHMGTKGPVGSVVAVPLADAIAGGYSEVELWRLP
jgi:cell wall-associated NlpC family hydrolase